MLGTGDAYLESQERYNLSLLKPKRLITTMLVLKAFPLSLLVLSTSVDMQSILLVVVFTCSAAHVLQVDCKH